MSCQSGCTSNGEANPNTNGLTNINQLHILASISLWKQNICTKLQVRR